MSEVHDPEVEQQSRLSSDQFADRIAQRELERIRQETPQFPRWFVNALPVPLIDGSGDVIRCVKHTDPGPEWIMVEGSIYWIRCGHPSCSLDGALKYVAKGWLREIGRAEAYAITGGNP